MVIFVNIVLSYDRQYNHFLMCNVNVCFHRHCTFSFPTHPPPPSFFFHSHLLFYSFHCFIFFLLISYLKKIFYYLSSNSTNTSVEGCSQRIEQTKAQNLVQEVSDLFQAKKKNSCVQGSLTDPKFLCRSYNFFFNLTKKFYKKKGQFLCYMLQKTD